MQRSAQNFRYAHKTKQKKTTNCLRGSFLKTLTTLFDSRLGLYVMDGIMKASRAKLASKDPYVERFAINVKTSVKQVLDACVDSEKELVMTTALHPFEEICIF